MNGFSLKEVKKLQLKKYRDQCRCFVVEGRKSIDFFLKENYDLVNLFSTDANLFPKTPKQIINEVTLKRMSNLKTPNKTLAVFKMPAVLDMEKIPLLIGLDDLQDPGNLGTIIRIAHWFGIQGIVCSKNTVDCYNPKAIQASMGSLAKVKVYDTDLAHFLEKSQLPIYGTALDGNDLNNVKLPQKGIYLMGNEANGLSKSMKKYCKELIYIPSYAQNGDCESLNVAVSTGILCSQIRKIGQHHSK